MYIPTSNLFQIIHLRISETTRGNNKQADAPALFFCGRADANLCGKCEVWQDQDRQHRLHIASAYYRLCIGYRHRIQYLRTIDCVGTKLALSREATQISQTETWCTAR